MTEYYTFAVDSSELLKYSEERDDIASFLEQPFKQMWLDIRDADEESFQLLRTHFKISQTTINEYKACNGRPTLYFTEEYGCLIFQRIFYNFKTESSEPREFMILFNTDWVITLHRTYLSKTFRSARSLIKECPSETLSRGTGYVVFQILELVLRDYNPIINEWQESLDHLEHSALNGSREVIMDQILKFKKLVTHLRRALAPQKETLNRLFERSRLPYVDTEMKSLFKIVVDDLINLLHEVENLSSHAGSVFEIYAAVLTLEVTEASNQLNEVMQRLSVITSIFLPLSFIVGIYGMNIPGMPELNVQGFYYILWTFMAVLVVIMLFLFRKLKWF